MHHVVKVFSMAGLRRQGIDFSPHHLRKESAVFEKKKIWYVATFQPWRSVPCDAVPGLRASRTVPCSGKFRPRVSAVPSRRALRPVSWGDPAHASCRAFASGSFSVQAIVMPVTVRPTLRGLAVKVIRDCLVDLSNGRFSANRFTSFHASFSVWHAHHCPELRYSEGFAGDIVEVYQRGNILEQRGIEYFEDRANTVCRSMMAQ